MRKDMNKIFNGNDYNKLDISLLKTKLDAYYRVHTIEKLHQKPSAKPKGTKKKNKNQESKNTDRH